MNVTASEFAFLALGLVLGVATGAALSIVIRARPPAPREIRLTVAADAVPRRPAATLSGLVAPGSTTGVGPASGGPADPSILAAGADDRTSVRPSPRREPVAIPIRPEPDPILATRDDPGVAPASTITGAR